MESSPNEEEDISSVNKDFNVAECRAKLPQLMEEGLGSGCSARKLIFGLKASNLSSEDDISNYIDSSIYSTKKDRS